MESSRVDGSLPAIISNSADVYQGDLKGYFRAIFDHAQNLSNPYHNFRHMFHVLWLCYQACLFYGNKLNRREMRNLLIAAIFHDFNHSGLMGDDDLNIERSVRGLEKYILPEDRDCLEDISPLIRMTEFPYTVPSESLPLSGQILRDADVSQALDSAWIQQVVFGLAAEWGKKPIEVLKMEVPFHETLKLHTEWAKQMFSQEDIDAKIREVKELIGILSESEVPV